MREYAGEVFGAGLTRSSLFSLPCLQRESVQGVLQYVIDVCFLMLASRDGSNGQGDVRRSHNGSSHFARRWSRTR